MSARFVIWGCVAAFAAALLLAYVLTEPGDGVRRTDLIVGTNGESDTLVLTSHSATILPTEVTNVSELWGITPVEFLQSLTMERSPTDSFLFHEPIQNWITEKDLPGLLALADSKEPCATVGIGAPTSSTDNHLLPPPSTMGQEALFLIEGFRKGQYPPSARSSAYDEKRAQELKDWARQEIANGPRRD